MCLPGNQEDALPTCPKGRPSVTDGLRQVGGLSTRSAHPHQFFSHNLLSVANQKGREGEREGEGEIDGENASFLEIKFFAHMPAFYFTICAFECQFDGELISPMLIKALKF